MRNSQSFYFFFLGFHILLILNGFTRFKMENGKCVMNRMSHGYAHYPNDLIKNNPFTFRSRWCSDSFRRAFSIINYINVELMILFFVKKKRSKCNENIQNETLSLADVKKVRFIFCSIYKQKIR